MSTRVVESEKAQESVPMSSGISFNFDYTLSNVC